jgi:hypothetical protein
MAYKGKKLSELKGKELQARIAHLVATHNTAALPTKYLPVDQRRSREMNARLNSPVTPGSPLTNRDLAREANAATGVQYGGQETALGQELAQTQSHGRAVGDYFNQYLGALRASQSAQTAQAAATAGHLAAIGASGQQAATSADTSTLRAMQEDAQRRGASVDPQLAVQASQAAQVNRNTSDAQAGTANLLGQVGANYLAALQGAAGTQRGQALAQNQRDVSNVRQRQTALASEKGQSNLQYRSKRRSEEFTNVATAALTGQKQETADASFSAQTGYTPEQWAQLTPAERLEALRRKTKATTKPAAKPKPVADAPYKYGYTKKEWLALPLSKRQQITTENAPGGKHNPKKGPKPAVGLGSITPQEENKRADQINTIAGWLQKPPVVNGKPLTTAQILENLRTGKNPLGKPISPQILNAARSLADNQGKGLGPFGIHNAHLEGVHVKGRWKQIAKPKPKPKVRLPLGGSVNLPS